jgi:hypothetical protein
MSYRYNYLAGPPYWSWKTPSDMPTTTRGIQPNNIVARYPLARAPVVTSIASQISYFSTYVASDVEIYCLFVFDGV